MSLSVIQGTGGNWLHLQCDKPHYVCPLTSFALSGNGLRQDYTAQLSRSASVHCWMGECDACLTLTEFNVTPMPSEWVGIPRPGAFVFRGLKPREFASAGGHQCCHWCVANRRTFSHVNRRALFQTMDVSYCTKRQGDQSF